MAGMKCVLLGCDNSAVGPCNNCGMPICSVHGKKIDSRFYVCINCIQEFKRSRLMK